MRRWWVSAMEECGNEEGEWALLGSGNPNPLALDWVVTTRRVAGTINIHLELQASHIRWLAFFSPSAAAGPQHASAPPSILWVAREAFNLFAFQPGAFCMR